MKSLSMAGNDLRLKILTDSDTEIAHLYFRENQQHFLPWEPIRPDDFYSVDVIR